MPGESSAKPFENPVPAHLLLLDHPEGPRLPWHAIFTLKDYEDQYAIIVSADRRPGEILYSRSVMHRGHARANVFETNTGMADRMMTNIPRPIGDYSVMPSMPLTGFLVDWVDRDQTLGNSTKASLNFSTTTLAGTPGPSTVEFNLSVPSGRPETAKYLYFCNYMHDFLYTLGFHEASGNFQEINFTHTEIGGDPVRTRAHSAPCGVPPTCRRVPMVFPVMNMGLGSRTGRHTTLGLRFSDAGASAIAVDPAFHENGVQYGDLKETVSRILKR